MSETDGEVADRALATRFAEISGLLLGEADEELTFESVVKRAVEVVPGCDLASITLLKRRGRAETVAVTDDEVERLDAIQYALGEGPCLDAAFERGSVIVTDVWTEHRWPHWTGEARHLGIRAVVAIRLYTEDETLGALNLYSTSNGFDDESVDIALVFASHATEAMSKAKLVAGLRTALESRHTIGIAQGVLAVRYDITYERAFEVLHRYSNDHNIKLRDVAEVVMRTRGLPEAEDVAEPSD